MNTEAFKSALKIAMEKCFTTVYEPQIIFFEF